MKIALSEHFNYSKLIRFVIPSVIMMIFTSIYGVIDGFFVSNFVGKTAFSAVNLIIPVTMAIGAIGFMIGTGGSALCAMTLGTGDKERANKYFSMLVMTTVISGILLTAIGWFLIRPAAVMLGAEGEMLELSCSYGRILLLSITFFMLQNVFQSFFVTAEKPKTGLYVTIAAGLTNIVLDFVFIAVLKLGVNGAAAATALSQFVGGTVPLIYFTRKNSSLLRLTKAKIEFRIILKACSNGVSELMTNLSMSFVSMLYTYKLMRIAGENGVAAYGTIMYVNFIFISVFIGYSIGSAPIIGYNYGSGNSSELKNIFKKSAVIITTSGVCLMALAIALAYPLSKLFVGYDAELFDMTLHAFRLYSAFFLLCGFNIYGSAFFTALNNGAVSAVISFSRTLLFQTAAVLILPIFLGLNGIWLSATVSEICALFITALFIVKCRKKYNY